MKLLGGTLYVEFADLIGYGVTDAYLKYAVKQYRDGAARSWANIPDPTDRRRVLIAYEGIPAQTIRAKAIPAKADLIRAIREAEKAQAVADTQSVADVLRSLLPPLSALDRATLTAVRVERLRADGSTGELMPRESEGLPEKTLKQYGDACRWLALLTDPRWKKDSDRARLCAALTKWADWQGAVIAAFSEGGVKLPKNARKLTAKVAEYKALGARTVVSEKWGNANARKVTDEVLELLISLFANPRKPPFELVALQYNQLATNRNRLLPDEAPWPLLSAGAVKTNLMENDVKPVWTLRRHGLAYWKMLYEYTALRHRPTERDMLWVVDGTKVNYYYRTPGGVAAKLNVVAILDAHSDRWLGWAFCGQEDAATVGLAMRAALRASGGAKPRQVQYDNGPANKGFFGEGWTGLHFPAMPNNGQSKIIERAFGRLQQTVMRQNLFFTGSNITSPSLNGKANPDAVKALLKAGQLPTEQEAREQAALDFCLWNQTPQKKDGLSPAERYAASPPTEPGEGFTADDEMAAFWTWTERPIMYRRDGLTLEVARTRYRFEALAADGRPDLDWLARYTGETFRVRFDPEQPGAAVALHTADGRFVRLALPKEAMPMAVADYQPGDGAKIKAHVLGTKKAQKAHMLGALADIESRFDAETLSMLGHELVQKDVLNAAHAELELAQVAAQSPSITALLARGAAPLEAPEPDEPEAAPAPPRRDWRTVQYDSE